jgi:hypothetical protein
VNHSRTHFSPATGDDARVTPDRDWFRGLRTGCGHPWVLVVSIGGTYRATVFANPTLSRLNHLYLCVRVWASSHVVVGPVLVCPGSGWGGRSRESRGGSSATFQIGQVGGKLNGLVQDRS